MALQIAYKQSMADLAYDKQIVIVAKNYIEGLQLPSVMALDFLQAIKDGIDRDKLKYFPNLTKLIADISKKVENGQ